MSDSSRTKQDHQLHTFSSPYMLPTPLAELLNDHDGETVVLVTGVFDVLHREHINFLKKAQKLGAILVVALESDSRVRQLKGPSRPNHSQQKRREQLLELQLADVVVILPEEFSDPEHHRAVISQIQPTYLAVSSHTQHLDKKQAILSEYGGRVMVVYQQNPEVSTTQLLAK